jgi:hypothetical protein
MTDKAISPSRRRLIEDMAIGGSAPRLSTSISATSKGFPIFWAGLPTRPPRGCPSLSVVAGVDRHDGTDRQCQCHCPAVLL